MFGLYNLASCSYWVSSAANYILTSILSFFLDKYFTFQNKERSWKQVAKFIINIAVCYVLAYGIAKPVVMYILSGAVRRFRRMQPCLRVCVCSPDLTISDSVCSHSKNNFSGAQQSVDTIKVIIFKNLNFFQKKAWHFSKDIWYYKWARRSGGMADALDSGSSEVTLVWVSNSHLYCIDL